MSSFYGGTGGSSSGPKYIEVTVLPITNIDPDAYYLILNDSSSEFNKYTEYKYNNGAWEIIGENIDLSDLVTKEELHAIKAIVSLESLGLENYTGTTLEFIAAIRTSSMAVGSMAIGGVSLSDLPSNLSNCEIVVTRMDDYVTNLSISSNNSFPYQWFFNYWSGGESSNNVWRTYIDECYTKDEIDEMIGSIGTTLDEINGEVI